MELPTCVLPGATVAECDAIQVCEAGMTIQLLMRSIQSASACPGCSQPSTRIHSHYQRTLADLPWARIAVQIKITVRRFFCDNPDCPRRIFAERLPTIAPAWSRRTARLAETQCEIGYVAGGRGGAHLCKHLACPAGVDLLLDLVRSQPLPERVTPRVLGVDDWAMRKGQTYGTLLIDHERGCVVEVLADRTPETLAAWLKAHPGIEIVTRDRAEGYALGIRLGAPDALQVADRWHLLKNLTDALTQIFQDHAREIQSARTVLFETEKSALQPDISSCAAQPLTLLREPELTAADRRRQERVQQVHTLAQAGWTQRDIAQHLGCHPKTVNRDLHRGLRLTSHRVERSSQLDHFQSYILQRWNEGCRNAAQFLRELRPRGLTGGYTMVRDYVASLRIAAGVPARSRRAVGTTLSGTVAKKRLTPRLLAWQASRPPEERDADSQRLLNQLGQSNPILKTAMELAQSFARMVRERAPDGLNVWLAEATATGLKALRSFAKGLRDDYDAVYAALSLAWSNGRTEGNVNRLKCIKRQAYGRAKIDLLRQRLMARR
jgi:transposase